MTEMTKTSRRAVKGLTALSIVVMFSTALATTAAAQDGRSQVNLQATGAIVNDVTSGGLRQEATRSGGFLVGYSHQFHRWAGVEGNYGYTRNTQNFVASSGPFGVRSDIHQVTGAFVLHVPTETQFIRPYALAGAGALIFDPKDDVGIVATDRQSRPAFLYGGGLNFGVARNFGIRAEYRGFVYKAPDFESATLNLDKVTHLAQPSVGLFLRF